MSSPWLETSSSSRPRAPLVDGVQESDGAHVVASPLPGFEQGLFVTQDGDDLDGVGGEQDDATNFKFVRWERIGALFGAAAGG